jgi:hypothetical protein
VARFSVVGIFAFPKKENLEARGDKMKKKKVLLFSYQQEATAIKKTIASINNADKYYCHVNACRLKEITGTRKNAHLTIFIFNCHFLTIGDKVR